MRLLSTKREAQAADLQAQGYSDAQIAYALGIARSRVWQLLAGSAPDPF